MTYPNLLRLWGWNVYVDITLFIFGSSGVFFTDERAIFLFLTDVMIEN